MGHRAADNLRAQCRHTSLARRGQAGYLTLREGYANEYDRKCDGGDRIAGPVVVAEADDRGQDQQADQVHHLH